jgi:hypothetical protein
MSMRIEETVAQPNAETRDVTAHMGSLTGLLQEDERENAPPKEDGRDVTAHMGSLAGLLKDDEEQEESLSARGWMTQGAAQWKPEGHGSPPPKRSRGLADITNTSQHLSGKKIFLGMGERKVAKPAQEPPAVVLEKTWEQFMQLTKVEFRQVAMSNRRLTEVPHYLNLSIRESVRALQLAQHGARADVREAWVARTEEWNRAHLKALRAAEKAFPTSGDNVLKQLTDAEAAGRLDAFREDLQVLRSTAGHRGKAAWEDHRVKLAQAELPALQQVTEAMLQKKAELQAELSRRRENAQRSASRPVHTELYQQVQDQKDQSVKLRMRHFELETFCRLHPLDLTKKEPVFSLGLTPNRPVVLDGDRGGMTRVQRFRLPAWERRIRLQKGRDGQYNRAELWTAAVAASLLEHCLAECQRLADGNPDVQVLELDKDGSILRIEVTCQGALPPHTVEQVTVRVPKAHEYPHLDWNSADVRALDSDITPYRDALAEVTELGLFKQLPAAIYRVVSILRKEQGWNKRRD